MRWYVFLTFGVLGFAWYELSGGAEFEAGPIAAVSEVSETALDSQSLNPATQAMPVAERTASLGMADPVKPDLGDPDVVKVAGLAAPAPVAITVPAPAHTPIALRSADVVVSTQSAAVVAAAPIAAPDARAEQATLAAVPTPDLRLVTGSRVNMREGPGTNYAVLAKLAEGDQVEVLNQTADGWIEIMVRDTGLMGWMADWLVTAAN